MKEYSKKEKNQVFKMIGFILILVSVVLIIWFLLRGQVSVNGNYPDSISSKSLTCEANDLEYYIFKDEYPTKTNIKINMIFDDDSLDSMSLIYIAYYENNTLANQALTRMHADMNFDFGADLGADAFSANYDVNNSGARMSLHAFGDDLKTERERKYFLLSNNPIGIDAYLRNYKNQHFDCKINDQ